LEVKIARSNVNIENARENLEKETTGLSFEKRYQQTVSEWNHLLSKIRVGAVQKTIKLFFILHYITL